MGQRNLHGLWFAFVALVLAAFVGGTTDQRASAQGDDGFIELSAIPAVALEGEVLFLPLDESFQGCVPLSGPCPQDSSTLLLVPAANRRVMWTPEAVELPGAELADAAIPAVGTPPASPTTARFLTPVLDGRGASLVYLRRRFSGGVLVDDDDEPSVELSDEPYVLHVQGPALSTVAPAASVPERLISTPALVDAEELVDATSVLVVRRAAPSRVVFGIKADPAWGLSQRYVGLIDHNALAAVARHDDVVGLVVTADAGAERETADGEAAGDVGRAGDPDEEGGGLDRGAALTLALAAVALAAITTGVVVLRRARRASAGR